PAHSIRSRPARGGPPSARISRDPDILASHLEDASHFPGGHVDGLVVVSSEADVAEAVRCARTILPIGAQSSLTGGATPSGGTSPCRGTACRMCPSRGPDTSGPRTWISSICSSDLKERSG